MPAARANDRVSGTAAAAGPYDLYAAKLSEADAAARDERWLEAVRNYRLAYESLPASDRAGDFGEDVVFRVSALSREEDFRRSAGVAGLKEAAALIERYLEDVDRFKLDREVAVHEDNLAELTTAIEHASVDTREEDVAHDRPPPPETVNALSESIRDVPAMPTVPSTADSGHEVDRPRPRRGLAIGLSVGGAALALGSAGLFANGILISSDVDQVRTELTDPNLSAQDRDRGEDYIKDHNPRVNGSYAGGATMLIVGMGLVASGVAIHLLDRKRAAASVSLSPSFSSDRACLSVAGRF